MGTTCFDTLWPLPCAKPWPHLLAGAAPANSARTDCPHSRGRSGSSGSRPQAHSCHAEVYVTRAAAVWPAAPSLASVPALAAMPMPLPHTPPGSHAKHSRVTAPQPSGSARFYANAPIHPHPWAHERSEQNTPSLSPTRMTQPQWGYAHAGARAGCSPSERKRSPPNLKERFWLSPAHDMLRINMYLCCMHACILGWPGVLLALA